MAEKLSNIRPTLSYGLISAMSTLVVEALVRKTPKVKDAVLIRSRRDWLSEKTISLPPTPRPFRFNAWLRNLEASGKLLGMHFFKPRATALPLVEVDPR